MAFGERWSQSAKAMSRGEYTGIGDPDNVAELAPLLRTRASMLQDFAEEIRSEENSA